MDKLDVLLSRLDVLLTELPETADDILLMMESYGDECVGANNKDNPDKDICYGCMKETWKEIEAFAAEYERLKNLEELAKKQEPLGGEFEKVLHDNLCDLYEK